MNINWKEFISVVIVTSLLSLFAGSIIGCMLEDEHHKDEAVKQGHAEYYLDENNEKQWRWKEKNR